MSRLKTIVLFAQRSGMMTHNPFQNYKITVKRVDRGYLTEEELIRILEKEFTIKRLEQVRDVFIFSCFTGLAYIDVKNLNHENIRKSFDGEVWIMTKRQKTDVQSNVLLLDIPRRILQKYNGKLPNGKILPVLSNQKTNAYLKEIGDLCSINKEITFHLARHTFATTVTLAKGVPIETVSKMLGHTNIQTTQIYARITNSKISKDMGALVDKLGDMNKAVHI
jgi:site-specific recombinase XerD